MNWKYPFTLAVFLGLLLSACKKESNPPNAASLKFATAKQGDTLILTGNNFSKEATTVTLNGQEVAVVKVTPTEITIVIPDNATSGNVTVTVGNQAMEIGALTIAPLTFYCLKHDLNDYRNEKYQIMTINPEDGSASVLLDITSMDEFRYIHNLKYLPTTNEVVGLSYGNYKLLKINATTKQTTVLPLSDSYVFYGDLTVDKYGTLYSVKDGNAQDTLVKIDPVTGKQTVVLSSGNWERLVYISSNNEMVSIDNSGRTLTRTNLTKKEVISKIELTNSNSIYYGELVPIGSEIYSLKDDYSDKNNEIQSLVNIDPVTGTQTVIKTLQPDEFYQRSWVYVPQRKAIYSLHKGIDLFRYNIDTQKFTASAPFTTLPDVGYSNLASN